MQAAMLDIRISVSSRDLCEPLCGLGTGQEGLPIPILTIVIPKSQTPSEVGRQKWERMLSWLPA